MRLYILSDAEGTAGVVNFWDYSRPEFRYYETTRRLVTLEINAAIEGALEAGVTDVYVADAHGPGAVNVELLHPEARVLTGRPITSPFGFDDSFDMLFMLGHHAKSNTDGGHLSHSWAMAVEEMWINGLSVGEIGTWMILAGQLGVPVPLITGDRAACEEAATFVPPSHTVVTKEGWRSGPASGLTEDGNRGHNGGAVHIHPEKARERIRAAATRAVYDHTRMPHFRMDPPYELVMIERPKREGDPHLIAHSIADDARRIMTTPRTFAPLQEDLATFVERMNATSDVGG
jgi:D-amino peptidase